MKNKHFLFSLSISLAALIVAILSMFLKKAIFDDIAKVLALPFFIFTIASILYSTCEEIITICKHAHELALEKIHTHEQYIRDIKHFISIINKTLNATKPVSMEEVEEWKYVKNAKATIDGLALDSAIHIDLSSRVERNKSIASFYIFSLTLILTAIMLTPILAPYLSFMPATSLTLLSLSLAFFEILLKTPIANKIVDHKYKKALAKHKEQNND